MAEIAVLCIFAFFAGLVDAVEVAVIPILLGGGVPLLPRPAHQAKLRLVASRAYRTGIMSLEYAVEPEGDRSCAK